MKNIKYLVAVALLIFLTNACDQKEKSSDSTTNEKEQTDKNADKNAQFMQSPSAKKMEEINAIIDPSQMVQSLRWEKHTDHGSEFTTVTAYMNEDGTPMKIVEHFIDGDFQPEGKREYYLEDNKLIFTQEFKDIWVDSNLTQYVETKTVYENEQPTMTLTRSAAFDDIQDSTWKKVTAQNLSLKKVNDILKGEGRFQTHFISVIKAKDLFLLLGENKEETMDRYTTAVRVDEMTPFIEDLLNHLDDYKYRPVEIEFKIVGGNNQATFRALTAIRWKDQSN